MRTPTSTAGADRSGLAGRARRFCPRGAREKPDRLAVDRRGPGDPAAVVAAWAYP